MRDEVEKAIAKIRPSLGTNIVEVVDVSDGVARVRVIPSGCSAGNREIPTMYSMPVEMAVMLVEEQIQEDVPEVKKVIVVD